MSTILSTQGLVWYDHHIPRWRQPWVRLIGLLSSSCLD